MRGSPVGGERGERGEDGEHRGRPVRRPPARRVREWRHDHEREPAPGHRRAAVEALQRGAAASGAHEVEPGDESRARAEPDDGASEEGELEARVQEQDEIPEHACEHREQRDALGAEAVGSAAGRKLDGEVCDEQGGGEQAHSGDRDAVVLGQRIGGRADVRDVPGEAAADREPRRDSGCGAGQRPPPSATQATVFDASRSSAETASSRCSSRVSSSFVCERPRRLWTKSITVGTPARETSAASCSGPEGRRCDRPVHLLDRLLGKADQRVVEEDRLDRPDALPGDVDRLLGGEALARRLRLAEHRRKPLCAQVALIEKLLRGLDDRGHDARLADDSARGADGASAGAPCDFTDLERELRRAGERVAALVHRRRAGMRRLSTPRDAMPLDTEGPEHDSEGKPEALEHRTLLDMQLEVGGGRVELLPRRERRVEIDAVSREGIGKRNSVAVRELAQLVLVRHRACGRARSEEAAPEPRALLVRPVDEANRDRRRALSGDPPQHFGAGDDVQGAVEPAAVREPSRCGRRSGPLARTRPEA